MKSCAIVHCKTLDLPVTFNEQLGCALSCAFSIARLRRLICRRESHKSTSNEQCNGLHWPLNILSSSSAAAAAKGLQLYGGSTDWYIGSTSFSAIGCKQIGLPTVLTPSSDYNRIVLFEDAAAKWMLFAHRYPKRSNINWTLGNQ